MFLCCVQICDFHEKLCEKQTNTTEFIEICMHRHNQHFRRTGTNSQNKRAFGNNNIGTHKQEVERKIQ